MSVQRHLSRSLLKRFLGYGTFNCTHDEAVQADVLRVRPLFGLFLNELRQPQGDPGLLRGRLAHTSNLHRHCFGVVDVFWCRHCFGVNSQ